MVRLVAGGHRLTFHTPSNQLTFAPHLLSMQQRQQIDSDCCILLQKLPVMPSLFDMHVCIWKAPLAFVCFFLAADLLGFKRYRATVVSLPLFGRRWTRMREFSQEETDRQTDRQADRQADTQTWRQTNMQMQSQRNMRDRGRQIAMELIKLVL